MEQDGLNSRRNCLCGVQFKLLGIVRVRPDLFAVQITSPQMSPWLFRLTRCVPGTVNRMASAPDSTLCATRAETLEWVRSACLLYTSDAADEEDSVDIGGRRIIINKITQPKKKNRS
eukprot:TRINITY_DN12600_c0_g1_i1.p1 TRINITY_DN12600_c0_g1~~TRINITY_DN12600_c0_g1_i1.p1  ORF type:complete len:117 (+),score=2.92 TRINITY_DN12600_c0_g1_i1:263-613(+)